MRQKSVTVDEIIYIAAGYYHLRTGDFQMNMTNPPLMKLVAALPVVGLRPDLPRIENNPKHWNLIKQWQWSRTFLYGNHVDADRLLFLARLPIVGIALILGIYVFLWSKELYGDRAALFALFLYSFSPNILAHAGLATQDLGLTTVIFIFCYYFWKYVQRPNAKYLVLSGALLGTAALTKNVALLLIPISAIYAIFCIVKNDGSGTYEQLPLMGRMSDRKPRLRQSYSFAWSFLVIGVVAVLVVNIGYGFQGSLQPLSHASEHPDVYAKLPVDTALTRAVTDYLLAFPFPLPSPYIVGLKFQSQLVAHARDIYFDGIIYPAGKWYFTLAAFAMKTPIATMLLLGLSLALLIPKWRKCHAELLMLAAVVVILYLISSLTHVNVAIRYILPIYPFLFVLISRLLSLNVVHVKVLQIFVVALCAWYFAAAAYIYPHYLAYFNEFVGGPKNGYKYLVTTNLDQGQDLKGLKAYMEKHAIRKIKLGYYGSADARYYGIEYDYLPSVGLAPTNSSQKWWYEMDNEARQKKGEPQPGILAVSATLLVGRFFPNAYTWLRELDPVDNIGYSIHIYKVEGE